MQFNHTALTLVTFERRLMPLNKRDDDITVISRVRFTNDHHIAIIDARIDHGIAAYLQCVMLTCAGQHGIGHRHMGGGLADRLNRHTGGDATHHGEFCGAVVHHRF